ncbi:Os01g0877450, partial [Oryza sativa Japonica Group]
RQNNKIIFSIGGNVFPRKPKKKRQRKIKGEESYSPTTLHWSQYTDRDRSTSSSTTLSSTAPPPPSSSPSSPTRSDTLHVNRCGGAAAAAGEKIEGRGSSRAYLARNPLTASRNVPAAPPSPAGGNPAKSLASTRVLALFSGRLFTTISPFSPAVGSPQICLPPSPPPSSSSNQIGTRVRVCGGGGYEIKRRKVMGSIPSRGSLAPYAGSLNTSALQ